MLEPLDRLPILTPKSWTAVKELDCSAASGSMSTGVGIEH
jgi:hypothetical protein